jgi:UDP-glucose 4-epimerase/UDP-glucuronate decarboxylase
MSDRRVLLTGGAGFIGLRLTEALAQSGAEVTVMDDLSRGRMDEEAGRVFTLPGVTFVRADLCDPSCLDGMDRFDTLVHAAAVIGIQAAAREPVRVLRTNALSTINIVDFWRRTGGSLIFTSTSEVYGALMGSADMAIPSPEDVPVGVRGTHVPRYSYAVSKIFGEMLVRQAARETGLRAIVIRPHNVYGPRMGWDHVIPQMSIRAIRGEEPFRVFGADETRAFCHVSDFCRAVTMLDTAGAGGLFHVGTDVETRIRDLALAILALADRPAVLREMPSQEGSPPRRCPDISRLRAATGFEPCIGLGEGLSETFRWYRSHAAANPAVLSLDATP